MKTKPARKYGDDASRLSLVAAGKGQGQKERRTVMSVSIKFHKERETKNTWRFAEDGDPEQHKVGTLYVQKRALAEAFSEVPESVVVEIKAA